MLILELINQHEKPTHTRNQENQKSSCKYPFSPPAACSCDKCAHREWQILGHWFMCMSSYDFWHWQGEHCLYLETVVHVHGPGITAGSMVQKRPCCKDGNSHRFLRRLYMKETVMRYLISGENPIPLAFYDICAETKLRQRSRKRRSCNLCDRI